MSATKPLTIGNGLLDAIGACVASSSRYLHPNTDPFDLMKWTRDAEALMRVNAIEGSLVRSKLAEAQGDIVGAERWIENARKNGAHAVTWVESLLVSYANLGYASKALQVFRDHVDVRLANIGATIRLTSAVGAFDQMRLLMTNAAKAGIKLGDDNVWPETMDVASAVQKIGMSDDERAKIIDIAGEILRRRQLFWTGDRPTFIVNDAPACVLMHFNADVTYAEAAEMNSEAIDLLIDQNLDAKDFMIGFVGSKM